MADQFPKSYSPGEVEDKWYHFWEENDLFVANPASEKPPYCIVLPPPNVTGALHMGHALVDTVQDILIRWKRMQGFETFWAAGVDHAGISTQTVVERHLINTQGKRRVDFSREEFLSHVWDWKEKNESKIVSQLKKLGCSCDWSKKRFTMDEKSNKAVKRAFKKMFEQKLIYRGDYLVNWDPITKTALADDEVEYEERTTSLWYFKYPVDESDEFIQIATTRPETLLGDTGVAVSPKDERFKHLIGKSVRLPIMDRLIPVIEDHYVDPEFGTGAVKMTPAHDHNDYEISKRHDLQVINLLTEDGFINENGGEYQGLTPLECREKVVSKMQELGLFVKKEPYTHRVGISYRSKAVIEPFLSKQWFISMEPFKEGLMRTIKDGKIKMVPKYWQNTYFHWISNLRDWCISRQLWWGHQIPIWYNKDNPEEMICHDGEGLPDEVKNNPDKWEQDPDVLDTWFSSSLWPFSILGWPENTPELKKFYPTSTLVTGHDILFFWVARMILMGEYILDEKPFSETFLHGLIYGKSYWKMDEQGQAEYLSLQERTEYDLGKKLPKGVHSKWEKMSKSKGNVIDPLEIIELYGADAMRMALMSSLTHSRQIDLDRRKFEEFKNFSNKLWNSARFIFQNLEANEEKNLPSLEAEDFKKPIVKDALLLEDRWILSRANQTILDVTHHLSSYEFDKASQLLYSFFWDEFCAYYVEISKPYLFGKEGDSILRAQKQKVLSIVFLISIRVMHPFTPFITEELFSKLKSRFQGIAHYEGSDDPYTRDFCLALGTDSCMIAPYPTPIKEDISKDAEAEFALMQKFIHSIRNTRGEMQIPPSTSCDVYFVSKESSNNAYECVKNNLPLIKALIKTKEIKCFDSKDKEPDVGFSAFALIENTRVIIPLPSELKEKEKKRLEGAKEKLLNQLKGIEAKLQNTQFIEKAPKQLIENTKKSLEEAKLKLEEIEKKSSAL